MPQERMGRIKEMVNQRIAKERTEEVKRLLSSVPGLTLFGFKESMISSGSVWRMIVPYDAQPNSTLSVNTTEHEKAEWLAKCLGDAGIADRYLLNIDSGVPWADVRVHSESDWLLSLWQILEQKACSIDSVIFCENTRTILGFIETEYYYEAHLFSMDDMANAAAEPEVSG